MCKKEADETPKLAWCDLKELMGFHLLQDRGMGEIPTGYSQGVKTTKNPFAGIFIKSANIGKMFRLPYSSLQVPKGGLKEN